MIPAADVLRKITDIIVQPAFARWQSLAQGVLEDVAHDRLFCPEYNNQHPSAMLTDRFLSIHTGFFLRVLTTEPFGCRAYMMLSRAVFTPHDGRQILELARRHLSRRIGQSAPRELKHVTTSTFSTGALFVGMRRGTFVPVRWVHRDISCDDFAECLDLALTGYLYRLSEREHQRYY